MILLTEKTYTIYVRNDDTLEATAQAVNQDNRHTHAHTHVYIYIYIYIERERERERVKEREREKEREINSSLYFTPRK